MNGEQENYLTSKLSNGNRSTTAKNSQVAAFGELTKGS